MWPAIQDSTRLVVEAESAPAQETVEDIAREFVECFTGWDDIQEWKDRFQRAIENNKQGAPQ